MLWFVLVCCLSGAIVGGTARSVVVVILTSLQIFLFCLSLALATKIGVERAAIWCLAGLVAHQCAYLGTLLAMQRLDMRTLDDADSVSPRIRAELMQIDLLAQRIATSVPAPVREDATALAQRVADLLSVLHEEDERGGLRVIR